LVFSSEEQELCVHQRLSAEGRVKILEEEIAQVRVNLEQQRTDNDEMKKTMETKDEELREVKKQQDNSQKSANICKTELVCLRIHICIG
jgi:chromosome segregation ATPase